ncbi:MAG TPA: hypothetical protein VG370_33140, partial [Chloroflexota bacterium]|nr:hypothetical protein [Chloroflexota bacterium]
MTEREQQAELLDRYWATLRRDLTASPPGELDRELAEVAERLERHLRPPEPNAGFARDLRRRLDAEAAALAGRRDGRAPRAARRWPTLQFVNAARRWWPLADFATAAALLVALVGVAYWISRPQPVSAQEILDKAQAAAADVSAAGVRSFALVEVMVARGPWTAASPSGEAGSVGHVWFKAPNRWRYEVTSPPGAGQGSGSVQRVTVADGETIWSYDSARNRLQIAAGALGGPGKGGPSLHGDLDGQDARSLDGVLKQARTCYDPVVAGEETVAGRRAYVVKMGATTCPSASGSEMNGPRTVWVDKETFFVLKNEIRDLAGKQVTYTEEVTSIRYNVDLPDDRFTYSAPPGATVRDNRPKPAPSADEFRRQVEAIARQA